jgi:hypothetical protein
MGNKWPKDYENPALKIGVKHKSSLWNLVYWKVLSLIYYSCYIVWGQIMFKMARFEECRV